MIESCGACGLTCGAPTVIGSGLTRRKGVLFPGAGFQDVFNLRKREVAFFFLIVKMGRDTDSGLRAIVDQNFAREKFAANLERVRAFDGNSSRTLRGILRRIDAPTTRARAFEKASGHANGFFADGADTDFV